jgi:ABC-type glycerol-3-phosphate transport system permease component
MSQEQNPLAQRARLWGTRAGMYTLLTAVAIVLLFPLIYMVIASLKTTTDFQSNPRRLIPYSPVEEAFQGRSIPLYTFEVNGTEQDYLISRITDEDDDIDKTDYSFLGTASNLENVVQFGSHADQRRLIDVRAIVPTSIQTADGDEISLTDSTQTLVRTGEQIVLPDNNANMLTFDVYDVVDENGEILSTWLQSFGEAVPVQAYILPSVADGAETIPLSETGEIELIDQRERGRDYGVFMLGETEFVEAYSAVLGIFFNPNDVTDAVYTYERLADPVEIVEFQLVNYEQVLGIDGNPNLRLDRALVNTIFVTILVTAGQITTSLFGGYAFSRIEFKGRDTIFLLYLGSIMVPFVVLIVPIYRLMVALGWNNHIASLIVPWIFTAYGTFLIRQFFLSIPKEIEEAALLDGCSRFRILWRIFVPLSMPAIAAHAIFTFLYAWNSFLWPLIIIDTSNKEDEVLTLALITLSNLNQTQPNIIMTGAAVMILPPMIVFILAQRYFIEGIATSGLKG